MTAENDTQVPEFGERVHGARYAERPGSYGLAFDDESSCVYVLRTGAGTFLPGGGANAGETEESTLRREVLEECGRAVEVVRRIGVAIEYVSAEDEGDFAKRCAFFEVRLGERTTGPSEDDHTPIWMSIEEARVRLSHASQRWALETAVRLR